MSHPIRNVTISVQWISWQNSCVILKAFLIIYVIPALICAHPKYMYIRKLSIQIIKCNKNVFTLYITPPLRRSAWDLCINGAFARFLSDIFNMNRIGSRCLLRYDSFKSALNLGDDICNALPLGIRIVRFFFLNELTIFTFFFFHKMSAVSSVWKQLPWDSQVRKGAMLMRMPRWIIFRLITMLHAHTNKDIYWKFGSD